MSALHPVRWLLSRRQARRNQRWLDEFVKNIHGTYERYRRLP